MAESRRAVYYNPSTGRFQRSGNADVFKIVIGTDVVSGEAFAQFDLLYIKAADGKAYKADATDDAKMNAQFIALEAATAADETIQVAVPGNEIPGMSALTDGSTYYLNPAAAGGQTATPPSSDGHWVVIAGTASDATSLVFNPQVLLKL